MGGAGVLRMLAKAPGRVRKLVGLTPVGAQPTPFDEAGHDLFWGAVDDPGKRFGIIDFTTGNRNTATWVQSRRRPLAEPLDGRGLRRRARGLGCHPDFLAEIAGSETPMLVVAGEHDPALGEATVRQTWEPHFPNCRST
jgi:pimeloyl-ACP methyl ester carboxylesterase